MKIMTFYFTASVILVVKVIEFIVGILVGVIMSVWNDVSFEIEGDSFLREAYHWACDHQWVVYTIACLIADVISVFILSAIF